MTDQSRQPSDHEAEAAAQVAELVVNAAGLLDAAGAAVESADRFTSLLRSTLGVRSVHPAGVRQTDRRIQDRRGRTQVVIPIPHQVERRQRERRRGERRRGERRQGDRRGAGPDALVVELAEAGDQQWDGDGQRQRLESALAVIATAVAPSAPWLPRDSAIAQLLTHTRSIIVRLDEGEWSVLSEAVTPVLGYSPDLVPSLEPLSVVDPRDKYPALRAFVRTRTGRCRECIVDLRVRSADGSTVVLETVFADLTGAPGVQAVVAYGIDVTEQRAERARFRALVMRLGRAALVVDERGGLVLANDAFTQLFGTQVGGWGGEDCEAALCAVAARCRDPEIAHQHLVDLTSRRRRSTGRLDLVDGCILDLEQRPLAEEGIHLGSLWLFRDVTAEVATSAALERDSRAAAFALERQNRLLATVSHEFRTPLTALLSFAELLADPRLGALNETQRSAIEVITRNTERLLRLVDDLLLLTRLESKQLPLRFSEVDVPELVRAAVADRALEARARHVEITCEADEGPPLLADTGRLHQVLGNVLSNALKFGAGGGSIQVSAEFSASAWAIETADSGIGIPPDDLVRITNSFERGSNAVDAGISGSGLGLAVCREVVELHGGTLSIASVLNVGTTVRIVLPVEGGRQP